MIVRVDLAASPAAVTLDEPDDCRRFHVAAAGGRDAAQVGEAVGRADESGDVFVDVGLVRRLAAGRVGEAWEKDFAGMLDFARSKGWLDESGQAIRAHVEWE